MNNFELHENYTIEGEGVGYPDDMYKFLYDRGENCEAPDYRFIFTGKKGLLIFGTEDLEKLKITKAPLISDSFKFNVGDYIHPNKQHVHELFDKAIERLLMDMNINGFYSNHLEVIVKRIEIER